MIRRMGSYAELEKEFFRMAKGGDTFGLVRDEVLLKEVRRIFTQAVGYLGPDNHSTWGS